MTQITRYFITRFTTLIPPLIKPDNPIRLLCTLNCHQTVLFLVSFLAWTWDSFGFFTVPLNIIEIANTYQKSVADITWGITATMMLRCVGAIIFGIISDHFGRKWPFVINIILCAITEISTGFCTSYAQFIIVRALFGLAMGGTYGIAAATALEDAPMNTRGILSGFLQSGYPLGYLLAAAFNLLITSNQPYGWRALFWFTGSLQLLIAVWRIFLPETQSFLHAKEARTATAEDKFNQKNFSARTVSGATRFDFSQYWPILMYLMILMIGFNFLSHGSQDLYPTFLTSQLKFSRSLVAATMVIANAGACIGGVIFGYFSGFFGRRLSMIVPLIIGAILIPAYVLPRNTTIMIGALVEQFCIHGAWSVIPVYLFELSPDQSRSLVVGTSYQLGNLFASATSTIEASASEHYPLQTSANSSDQHTYDYGKVMGIFLACNYVCVLILVLLGPEKRDIETNDDRSESNYEMLPDTQETTEVVPEK